MPTIALNKSKYFCTLPIKSYFKMWKGFFRIKGTSVVKIIAGISGIDKTSNARRTGPGAVLPGKSKAVCTHSISLPKNWQEDKNYHGQLFRLSIRLKEILACNKRSKSAPFSLSMINVHQIFTMFLQVFQIC